MTEHSAVPSHPVDVELLQRISENDSGGDAQKSQRSELPQFFLWEWGILVRNYMATKPQVYYGHKHKYSI